MSQTTASRHDAIARLAPKPAIRRVPGEAGIWLFVLLDSLIFVEMFAIFTFYRADHRVAFHQAQEAITPAVGLAYTVLLLSSSWCIVMAVSATRRGELPFAERFATWAILLGAAFAVLKVVEYIEKFASGYSPRTNDFLMFFFVMTFVHLLHACAGLIVLLYLRRQVRLPSPESEALAPERMRAIEISAVYWHMVDLLWVVLFALFYLRG